MEGLILKGDRIRYKGQTTVHFTNGKDYRVNYVQPETREQNFHVITTDERMRDHYLYIKDLEKCFVVPKIPSNVNSPSHYNQGNIEVIDYIEDQGLAKGFNRGNAIKYISRAGSKNPDKEIEDLEKAVWYVNKEIERLKK